MLTERVAYRPLRNSPRISNLITAIGVSLFLENLFMKIFTPNTRAFPKVFTQEPLRFGDIYLNYGTVVTIVLTAVLFLRTNTYYEKDKIWKSYASYK